jgi:hypothetical protein
MPRFNALVPFLVLWCGRGPRRHGAGTATAYRVVVSGNRGANAGFRFRGAGRSPVYRAEAGRVLNKGSGSLPAHRAATMADAINQTRVSAGGSTSNSPTK